MKIQLAPLPKALAAMRKGRKKLFFIPDGASVSLRIALAEKRVFPRIRSSLAKGRMSSLKFLGRRF